MNNIRNQQEIGRRDPHKLPNKIRIRIISKNNNYVTNVVRHEDVQNAVFHQEQVLIY